MRDRRRESDCVRVREESWGESSEMRINIGSRGNLRVYFYLSVTRGYWK